MKIPDDSMYKNIMNIANEIAKKYNLDPLQVIEIIMEGLQEEECEDGQECNA